MRGALLIAILAAAVGCGAAQSAATPSTSLTISYWAEGREEGGMHRWTLRCDPTGGTLPARANACARLDSMSRPFAPISKNVVCTDQYGGPQEAIVAGTFEGRRIWVHLALRNGCEISRAKRLAFLAPGLASGASPS